MTKLNLRPKTALITVALIAHWLNYCECLVFTAQDILPASASSLRQASLELLFDGSVYNFRNLCKLLGPLNVYFCASLGVFAQAKDRSKSRMRSGAVVELPV